MYQVAGGSVVPCIAENSIFAKSPRPHQLARKYQPEFFIQNPALDNLFAGKGLVQGETVDAGFQKIDTCDVSNCLLHVLSAKKVSLLGMRQCSADPAHTSPCGLSTAKGQKTWRNPCELGNV